MISVPYVYRSFPQPLSMDFAEGPTLHQVSKGPSEAERAMICSELHDHRSSGPAKDRCPRAWLGTGNAFPPPQGKTPLKRRNVRGQDSTLARQPPSSPQFFHSFPNTLLFCLLGAPMADTTRTVIYLSPTGPFLKDISEKYQPTGNQSLLRVDYSGINPADI